MDTNFVTMCSENESKFRNTETGNAGSVSDHSSSDSAVHQSAVIVWALILNIR
jgi:hypothetical protein